MEIPEGWRTLNAEESREERRTGREMLGFDNTGEDQAERTLIVNAEALDESNLSVMAFVMERTRVGDALKAARDFRSGLVKKFASAPVETEFGPAETTTVAGRESALVTFTMTVEGITFEQSFLMVPGGKRSLLLILTNLTDPTQETIDTRDRILNSIEFEKRGGGPYDDLLRGLMSLGGALLAYHFYRRGQRKRQLTGN